MFRPKLHHSSLAFFLTVALLLTENYSGRCEQPPNGHSKSDLPTAGGAHWAFQPLQKVEVPELSESTWPTTPIDRFILATLEENGLKPAGAATREQLIRRVTFDLVGMPPTPYEIDAFVNDSSSNAYEKVIDRLLASPLYGERWGRHWLDLARFAESDGFEHDAVRPHAWRYRDYVVRSFNMDKPYDRFVREQIAGDELSPRNRDSLIATAFSLLGPDMVDSSDQIQRRHNSLNDMTDTTGLVFLGLTVGCARCHDHKFEPISQRDYFRLQSFFTPAEFHRDFPIPTDEERQAYETSMKRYDLKVAEIRDQVQALEAPYRKQLRLEKLTSLSEETRAAHALLRNDRTPAQTALVEKTKATLKVSDKEIQKLLSDDEKHKREALLEEMKRLAKPKQLPMTLALQNGKGLRAKTHILARGDYNRPEEEVQPGIPEVLETARPVQLVSIAKRQLHDNAFGDSKRSLSGRTALANWIADSENPLTSRVMVNRIWQHHFGRGLVPTPSNLGTKGQPPTHPELLDWLAGEFVRRGWSIKQVHKVILLSATFRQSSNASPETSARDPENRYYSRWLRVRLEGEVIRDSLLAMSGRLNPAMEGPGVFPPIPKEVFKGAKGWRVSGNPKDHARRSIYIFARRNLRFPFLEVFDAPDNNLSCAARERSTTAPQSLTLLNSDEAIAAATAVAERLSEQTDSADEQISQACRLIFGRRPVLRELDLAREFLQYSPLSELCRALLNSNAFIYVD